MKFYQLLGADEAIALEPGESVNVDGMGSYQFLLVLGYTGTNGARWSVIFSPGVTSNSNISAPGDSGTALLVQSSVNGTITSVNTNTQRVTIARVAGIKVDWT